MRRVLITGGNKGIGFELTKYFVENGDQVMVVARDFSNFEYSDHPNVKVFPYDLSNVKGIESLVSQIGPVDVLINNAGVMNTCTYDQYSEQEMERLMNINLYAPIELINCVSKSMKEQGYGRIVNTSSVAGHIGHSDIWYGVSKAGIINATKSYAKLLAQYGIVVNAVAPGPVETDMLAVIPEKRLEYVKSSVYLGRFAKPQEVAQTIIWLATDCPEYINGTCIDINNGTFPR